MSVAEIERPLIFAVLQTDYLISRAEAALGSIDKVKKGHADYLRNMSGEFSPLPIWLGPADLVAAR